jgi:hypothetical protein
MANKKKGGASDGRPTSPEETRDSQEDKRNLEERIQDTKDATLRLWERTRSLQEKQGLLENRARLLPWIALGLLVGSVVVSVLITQRQLSRMQQQLAVLQTAPRQPVAGPNGDLEQLKRELLESVKQMAPDLLAAAIKDEKLAPPASSVGTTMVNNVATSSAAPSSAASIVKGPGNATLRIVVGRTDPKKARWIQYSDGGVAVEVDTSHAGFSSSPYYFTSLGGHTNNWMAQGVTSIYEPTAKGFRVHVGHRALTIAQAKEWGWYVNWIAIGE